MSNPFRKKTGDNRITTPPQNIGDTRTEILISPSGETSRKNSSSMSRIFFGRGSKQMSFDENIGLQVGPPLAGTATFAPFYVDTLGKIQRVASIKFASAIDLGQSSIEPDNGTKAIWANVNDVRYQAGTGSLHQFRTAGGNSFSILPNGETETHAKLSDLTDADVNTAVIITVPNNSFGGGTIHWTVFATDGTEYQSRTGITTFTMVNKAGTFTTAIDEIGGSVAVSSGTLTGTWSITTSGTSASLKFTPTSSLTPTTLDLYYTITNFRTTGTVATQ